MSAYLKLDPVKVMAEVFSLGGRMQTGMRRLNALEHEDVAIARTPSEVVHRNNKLTLLHYTPAKKDPLRTPVLLVYALVGRYSVADLQPGRSFVENLMREGLDVYAIDWGHPTRADRWTTLDDYVNVFIDECVDVLRKRHHVDAVNLLSICQAGVFNLCYAALHPEKVKNLVLTVTPVDFHADQHDDAIWRAFVNVWTRSVAREDIDLMVEALGNIPGRMTGAAFQMMNPVGTLQKYTQGVLRSLDDDESLRNFVRMEKWLYDQPDHAGEAARQWLEDLYQDNKLVRGELELGGQRVDLRSVRAPVLNIYAEQDHVVAPAAARALANVVGTKDYTEKALPGGHIGVFVGGKAQAILAPTIGAWLRQRDD
jgi:polyhydroxyalkanoate synthase